MSFECVVPFLSDSPEFCAGVEIGMLYRDLSLRPRRLEGTFRVSNDEQILLLARRMGYDAEITALGDGWIGVDFTPREY